jgi:hypothetical protein
MLMSFSRREPVAKLLGHPVDEYAQAWRQLAGVRIESMDRQRRGRKASEHLDQRAAGEFRADAIPRHLNQSEADARAGDIGFRTGHRHHWIVGFGVEADSERHRRRGW